jgi:Putative phage holin Dp-1
MNSKLYNVLKAVAQIWLPALGTLMFTIGDLWNLTWDAQAVGTIMAVDAFLGVGLGISTAAYKKNGKNFDGFLTVDTSNPRKDIYSIDMMAPLGTLAKRNDVTLKVRPGELASMQPDDS